MPQGTPQPSPSAPPPRQGAPSSGAAEQPRAPDALETLAEKGTERLPATRPGGLPGASPIPANAASASATTMTNAASLAEFFEEALTEAVTRLRADGGELVTFEPQLQALVLRARVRGNPLLGRAAGISRAQSSRPGDSGVEEQPTVVLPSAAALRIFPLDEGVRGMAFSRHYPIRVSGHELARMRPEDLPVSDASCCLAVPVFRASASPTLRPDPEVIGVLSVYIRSPMWTFSDADIDLLVVHADRIARTLALIEASREREQREGLLTLLNAGPTSGDPVALAASIREVAQHIAPSAAFTLLLPPPTQASDPDVTFLGAVWEGTPLSPSARPGSALPPWWQDITRGQTVRVSSPEEAARHPDYCQIGWETPQPLRSLVALPLRSAHPLGALVLADTHPGRYTGREIKLLETLAAEATLLLEHTLLGASQRTGSLLGEGMPGASHGGGRLPRQERAQNEELLSQFANAVLTLNASLDPDATARALVEQAGGLTTAAVRMVFLVDDEGKHLVGRATNWEPGGPHMPFREVELPLSWQDLGKQHDQPFLLLAPDQGDSTPEERFAAEYQMASCLVVPMERPQRQEEHTPDTGPLKQAKAHPLLGALLVYTPGQPYLLQPREVQHLQSLVKSASGAMSNAMLYHNLADAYEKQKELDKYKDDFILTVSHEFRTPLTAIEGYTGLISRHGNKLDQTKLDAFAQEIKQAMDQLTGMLGTLADVSRMDSVEKGENSELQVSLEPVNARIAATKALNQQQPDQQPRVTIELPEDLWVVADEERLTRAFSNLISNAIKYTENKPCRVTAHAATREELLKDGRTLKSDAEHWAVIGVRDYGSGISKEDQARLFNKFVRLPHSRTTPIRGTGLGLWICKEYMKAFKGDIWIESRIGDGSLFEFCLPLADPPSEA